MRLIITLNVFVRIKHSYKTVPDGMCMSAKWLQLCLYVCDPVDHSLPGSSVHGIFQIGLLEWIAMTFSRGSSWPRDWVWKAWWHSAWWYSAEKQKMMIVIILLQFSISLGTSPSTIPSTKFMIEGYTFLNCSSTCSNSFFFLTFASPIFQDSTFFKASNRYLYSRSPV